MFYYKRLSATGTAKVSGPSTLGTVNINNGAVSAVLTIYDSTSASGNVVAVVDATSKSSHGYLVYCPNGIYIDLSGGNADVTIGYS